MSLDGLRAWIGEVERKLRMRTRVFLALAVIAIGVAGAAIYLAIDTHDTAVSEGDVQALQEKLEARIGAGGGTSVAQLEAELRALQAEVAQLRGGSAGGGAGAGQGGSSGGGGTSGRGGSSSGNSSSGGAGGTGGATGGSGSGTSGGANPGASSGSGGDARLKELLEKTREEAEKAEGK
jgi:hypothetical protein